MNKISLFWQNEQKTIYSSCRKTVLEMLNDEGFAIYAPCGGKGACGKCRVTVSGDAGAVTPEEKRLLTAEEREQGIRLACHTYIEGQAEVHLPAGNFINRSKAGLSGGSTYHLNPLVWQRAVKPDPPTLADGHSTIAAIQKELGTVQINMNIMREIAACIDFSRESVFTGCGPELIDWEYGPTAGQIYGVAVDIGTTTIACYLLDLITGKQLAVASRQNPQFSFGADVISRIHYTLENAQGLPELRSRAVSAVDGLIAEAAGKAGIDCRYIYQCVLVGNTTMHHLFWGLSCRSLARLPFNAATTEMLGAGAGEAGLTHMNRNGKVVFLPGIAGFVGADTVGAMLAARLDTAADNRLLLDLGTNGEIVLATPGARYACSTAAGPAFEGARIRHGMQAFSGAIDTVTIADDIAYTTIDHQPARGICGSGLIDLVSGLLPVGVVKADGKIAEPEQVANAKLAARIVRNGRQKEIVVAYKHQTAGGEDIVLTQKDIRELQLAKGAIRAGVNILLQVACLPFAAVDYILLAGAFGNFINKESARRIGIFPHIALDRIIALGNAAGEGAKMALCDRDALNRLAGEFSATTRHIEISSHPSFQDEFLAGMYLV